jgi:uncharacterized membrane protein
MATGRPEIATNALLVFQKTEEYVKEALRLADSCISASKERTAILYTFIHGIVELNLVGHKESSKGLDNPGVLIEKIIKSMF